MTSIAPRPTVRIKAFDHQGGTLLASLDVMDRLLADARDPTDPDLPPYIRVGMDKKARHALLSARLLTVEAAQNLYLQYEPVDLREMTRS